MVRSSNWAGFFVRKSSGILMCTNVEIGKAMCAILPIIYQESV